jgi:IclR family pca regulon transcriptional regulator
MQARRTVIVDAPKGVAEPDHVPEPSARSDYVQSLARGLSVIEAFGAACRPLSLSEVAVRTGLTRAGARRALLTLEQLGYVGLEGRTFRLLPRILKLGYAYLTSLDVWDAAQPLLEDLVTRLGEQCTASVLDGDEIVCVARVQTRRLMNVNLAVGSRLPASACAMGRVLLGALDEPALDRYLATVSPPSFNPRTITDPRALRVAIQAARRDGYALVDQELEIGLRSLAVPIRDRRERVVAAMTICVHAARFTPEEMLERILPELRATATQIQRVMEPGVRATP